MRKKNNIEEIIEKKNVKKDNNAKKAAKTAGSSMVEKIAPKAEKNEKSEKKKPNTVQIIPLGGVDGIGMNMTAFEYGEDILLVDCGMAFPEENMPGVDVVIPDFTYLVKNAHKVRGLVLTHGHEDHIGAVPYLLKKVPCEVYSSWVRMLCSASLPSRIPKVRRVPYTSQGTFFSR